MNNIIHLLRNLTWRQVRAVLKLNKIFFETLTATLLSIMAIVVAWQSYQATQQQADLARIQMMPYVDVIGTQIYDEENSFYSENAIRVFNRNTGNLRGFRCDTAIFLEVTYSEKLITKSKAIPLTGYSPNFFQQDREKGFMVEIRGYKNNLKLFDLQKSALNYSKDGKVILIELKQYVKISYADILGQQHTEYFKVPISGYADAIGEKEGEKIFTDYARSFKNGEMVDYSTVSADMILSKIVTQ